MCEPHAVAVQFDDAGRRSRLDRSCRVAAPPDRVDQLHGGPQERRGDLRRLAGTPIQKREPVADETVQARGDRDVAGVGAIAALLQRPADLEREEGVSAGSSQ